MSDKNCENCNIHDVEQIMDGFDRAIPAFVLTKRLLALMIEEWCSGCMSHGYCKWERKAADEDWGMD